MNQGITEISTEQFSLEAFYETSVESLGIPEKVRKLYRLFVEERQYLIEHYWSEFLAEYATRARDDWAPVMWTRIWETPLSTRVKYVMRCYEIKYVGDLVKHTRKDLLKFRNLGRCSLNEITKYLATIGLELASD